VVFGLLLAVSNYLVVGENKHLRNELVSYKKSRHTTEGIRLPPLIGTDPSGRTVTIGYDGEPQDTLMLVFSPTCGYCKKTWPAWVDLVRGAKGKRVAYVNIGGPLSNQFTQEHGIAGGLVVAKTSAESVLKYDLQETPITLLISPDGHSKRVWAGVLDSSILAEVKTATGWALTPM
jgi:hypothetical protein